MTGSKSHIENDAGGSNRHQHEERLEEDFPFESK